MFCHRVHRPRLKDKIKTQIKIFYFCNQFLQLAVSTSGGDGGEEEDYCPDPGTENVGKFPSDALVGGWALPELTDGDEWDHSSIDFISPLRKLRGEWYEWKIVGSFG